MAQKLATTRTQTISESSNSTCETAESEKLVMTFIYNDKEYRLAFPENADSKSISQEIKRKTGVKGAFYISYGVKMNKYLHSSSLTRGNIYKLAGKSLEIRGGDWINKGGDSFWYYNSQTVKPEVIKKFRDLQWKPTDCPP